MLPSLTELSESLAQQEARETLSQRQDALARLMQERETLLSHNEALQGQIEGLRSQMDETGTEHVLEVGRANDKAERFKKQCETLRNVVKSKSEAIPRAIGQLVSLIHQAQSLKS